ncbi:MAG TPA: hypothetical protein VGE39_21235 [Prosthecobacter sp.]
MKTILCALITLPLMVASAAPDSRVASIQTLQGRTYRQCKILQRDADGIAFSHQKGMARVLFSDLPMSTRYDLGYDAKAAAALELSRRQQREERLAAQRLQQKRAAEQQQAARVAALRQYSLWQQQAAMMGYPYPAPFPGPVPAVGFAAPGWGYSSFGYGRGPFRYSRDRGWENVGIANIVPGTDGIYMPQSGGFIFHGLPQVHYSPTLGYYNPGYYARPPQRTIGTFGFVPGIGPAPAPPAVVPRVSVRGSASAPVPR